MNKHYHLLVETPEPNLVSGMKWLQGTYTQRYNARHHKRGHLFQGRYRAVPVQADAKEYFQVVSTYIHLNPARAKRSTSEKRNSGNIPGAAIPLTCAGPGLSGWLAERLAMGYETRVSQAVSRKSRGVNFNHQRHQYMNKTKTVFLSLASAAIVLSGCAKMPSAVTSAPAAMVGDLEKEPLATSLFPSDQAVLSDDAVARILSSRLELPAQAKVALLRFPGGDGSRYYGRNYWRDEEYLKLQQSQVDTLSRALLESGLVKQVTPLPSLMTPSRASIPLLREAALRMQADLLLVYRVRSDTYSQYRAFAKDKVKAYSTCELVLLDVRTGLAPFTSVLSRDRLEIKQSGDLDLSETMRRAEQASAGDALKAAAGELVEFVRSGPAKGGR